MFKCSFSSQRILLAFIDLFIQKLFIEELFAPRTLLRAGE